MIYGRGRQAVEPRVKAAVNAVADDSVTSVVADIKKLDFRKRWRVHRRRLRVRRERARQGGLPLDLPIVATAIRGHYRAADVPRSGLPVPRTRRTGAPRRRYALLKGTRGGTPM